MTRALTALLHTSHLPQEQRRPLHSGHLLRLPVALRAQLVFERGYGHGLGVDDDWLRAHSGGVEARDTLLATADVVMLVKPKPRDLLAMKPGALLWGFCNCVQQRPITQAAIDRRLTLIGFEAMNRWVGAEGAHKEMPILYRNSELAGYCAVRHALPLVGFDGHYGPPRRAAVLGFGAAGRGVVHGLLGVGIRDITVFTQRPPHLVRDRHPACTHRQMAAGPGDAPMVAVAPDGAHSPLVDTLGTYDVVANATLQHALRPLMFVRQEEVHRLKPGSLLLDVSCDEGMGFPWARPTSFEAPTFPVGPVTYYAVEHTPSYLWPCATWEISEALLPYLPLVMDSPQARAEEPTLRRATEILDGVVQNPTVLAYQGREADYPHAPQTP